MQSNRARTRVTKSLLVSQIENCVRGIKESRALARSRDMSTLHTLQSSRRSAAENGGQEIEVDFSLSQSTNFVRDQPSQPSLDPGSKLPSRLKWKERIVTIVEEDEEEFISTVKRSTTTRERKQAVYQASNAYANLWRHSVLMKAVETSLRYDSADLQETLGKLLEFASGAYAVSGESTVLLEMHLLYYMGLAALVVFKLLHKVSELDRDILNVLIHCNYSVCLCAVMLARHLRLRDGRLQRFSKEYQHGKILIRVENNNRIVSYAIKRIIRYEPHLNRNFSKFLKEFRVRKPSPSHSANYVFQFLAYYQHLYALAADYPLTATAPSPYLAVPPLGRVLVLQPYGLLFVEKQTKVVVRPFAKRLIQTLQQRTDLQLVLFTNKMPLECEWVIDELDPLKKIVRLYRYHCLVEQSGLTKDLRRMGCDLDRLLAVQPGNSGSKIYPEQNVLEVRKWSGSRRDLGLEELTRLAEKWAESGDKALKFRLENVEQIHALKVGNC